MSVCWGFEDFSSVFTHNHGDVWQYFVKICHHILAKFNISVYCFFNGMLGFKSIGWLVSLLGSGLCSKHCVVDIDTCVRPVLSS